MAKGMLALLWSLDVLTRVLRFLVPDEARYDEMQQIFDVLWHGQRKEKLDLIQAPRSPLGSDDAKLFGIVLPG
jgi:hypothetical protein